MIFLKIKLEICIILSHRTRRHIRLLIDFHPALIEITAFSGNTIEKHIITLLLEKSPQVIKLYSSMVSTQRAK